jgi:hypothetical protein
VTDTPPPGDDDLLETATTAPAARQHRSHRSHRRRGLRPIDIAGIVVAVLVVIGVGVVIAKGHKSSTNSATATTAAGETSTTVKGNGPNATTWTFTTLDGKVVVVTKGNGGSTRFGIYKGNSLPLSVIAIQKALAKNDCAAAQKLYVAGSTPNKSVSSTARRSAYAHFAVIESAARGCAWAKATTTTTA